MISLTTTKKWKQNRVILLKIHFQFFSMNCNDDEVNINRHFNP